MLQARALFYALVVCLMTALVSGLLISLSVMQSMQQTDQFEREALVRNVKSGIALLKSNKTDFQKEKISLYGELNDTVLLEKFNWGLYKVGYSSAIHQSVGFSDTLTKVFFLGEKSAPHIESALFLSDQKDPLMLVGSTKIKGTVHLPKSGVKRGFISGMPYEGVKLVNGIQKESSKFLPTIDQSKLEQLLTYLNVTGGSTEIPIDLKQPFTDSTLFFTGESIVLGAGTLEGRMIIVGRESVRVLSNCGLKDVIIIAPKITFEAGFSGQVQAFATKQLLVGESCSLAYPSVVGLIKLDRTEEKCQLELVADARVEGFVFTYDEYVTRTPSLLSIGKGSVVKGQVYGNRMVELKGAVYGNVIAKQFFLNTGSATYTNYLAGATIDRSKLSKHYLSPLVEKEGKELNILQWVD